MADKLPQHYQLIRYLEHIANEIAKTGILISGKGKFNSWKIHSFAFLYLEFV